jgi:hypothetical protein
MSSLKIFSVAWAPSCCGSSPERSDQGTSLHEASQASAGLKALHPSRPAVAVETNCGPAMENLP